MSSVEEGAEVIARPVGRPKRDGAVLLDAAAAAFVASGIDAPVREIAERAGVGVGTLYRHFPTRSDLVVAVYRHQVEACAEAGPRLLAESATPEAAMRAWVALFVDFLVTKHGLADALRGDSAGADALHEYFVGRLVPVCGDLLEAARGDRDAGGSPTPTGSGSPRAPLTPYAVLRGIGNLCIGAADDDAYDADALVQAFLTGVLAVER